VRRVGHTLDDQANGVQFIYNQKYMSKPLAELITDFIEYGELEKNFSQGTVHIYDFYLRHFVGWLQEQYGSVSAEDLSYEMVKKYRLYLTRQISEVTKHELKRSYQNYFMIGLRAFLRYLILKGYKTLSPDQVELGKQGDRVVKFLQNEQLETLLGAPDTTTLEGIRDKAILETLFSTGLRVAELTGLNRDSINLDKREFGVVGKGRKARVVFLSEDACVWLKKYLGLRKDKHIPLFIRYNGKKHHNEDEDGEDLRLTPRSVARMVEKYVKQQGLSVKATPHTLRHSFATDLLMNGADLRSVQEMLGHSNIATTQIYTHVTDKHLKDIHSSFHSGNDKNDNLNQGD
jgi:site-specific recombinase XerD